MAVLLLLAVLATLILVGTRPKSRQSLVIEFSGRTNSKMFRQRKDHPITEMSIQRDQRSLLSYRPVQDQRIIRPRLPDLFSADYVVPFLRQQSCEFNAQHLIEVKAHRRLRCVQSGDLRMENRLARIFQSGLNVLPLSILDTRASTESHDSSACNCSRPWPAEFACPRLPAVHRKFAD
jgi:hypothetical protein